MLSVGSVVVGSGVRALMLFVALRVPSCHSAYFNVCHTRFTVRMHCDGDAGCRNSCTLAILFGAHILGTRKHNTHTHSHTASVAEKKEHSN